MDKKRVTFYVDGFNFYYGLRRMKHVDLKWKKYYWINVVKLFEQFLGPNQELSKVVYFTASPHDPGKSSRQSAFLNANVLLNPKRFVIVRGKYINKTISCPFCKALFNRPEEKKTDVNLSVKMIGDCLNNESDVIVLVSADSDLIPPLDFILKNFADKKVKVYFPPANNSNDISSYMKANKSKVLRLEKNEIKFANAIMLDSVTNGIKTYTIPGKWK